MRDTSSLSLRQQRMLEMLRSFSAQNGYPPTIRQIGEAVGISSTSVVSYNLNVLQRKGYITRDRDVSRGLRLVEEEEIEVQVTYVEESEPEKQPLQDALLTVPLLGFIAAGQPIPIPDSTFAQGVYDQVIIANGMAKDMDGVYALQVRGTSMIDALINDGDIVVMRHQLTAENGDMVAAWLKDEKATTLKRFFWEKGHTMVRLQPANPTMEPIYVPADEVEIQGKVIGVIRCLDV